MVELPRKRDLCFCRTWLSRRSEFVCKSLPNSQTTIFVSRRIEFPAPQKWLCECGGTPPHLG